MITNIIPGNSDSHASHKGLDIKTPSSGPGPKSLLTEAF